MDIKVESDRNADTVGDSKTPLTSKDRSCRQKINKETEALNYPLDLMNLIDIFRAFHPKAAKCTYFSSALIMFSRIDHILGEKKNISVSLRRLESYQASSLTTML